MTCPNCRRENQPGSARCAWCGNGLAATPYPYAPALYAQPAPRYKPPGNPERNWAAITGMVCGIASILCSVSLFGGLFLAAAAIPFSVMGLKSAYKGMAIAGLVCGIVGLTITGLCFALMYEQIIEILSDPYQYLIN